MRVLWFTNTASCYQPAKKSASEVYNGGGWIAAAEKVLNGTHGIELAVSFVMDDQPIKSIQNGVSYYPIPDVRKKKKTWKLRRNLYTLIGKRLIGIEQELWSDYTAELQRVVEDFSPDIIHVWGSENFFGLVGKITSVPVLIHLQGILSPYLNAFLSPGVSLHDFYGNFSLGYFRRRLDYSILKMSAYREREIFKCTRFFAGRTQWDKGVISVMKKNSSYYYCGEILRDTFYQGGMRNLPQELTIITTISQPLYKGLDLILKTAKVLKDYLGLDFKWKCYGNVYANVVEKKTQINHSEYNVQFCGVASAEELRESLLSSTLYFHSSYIDNSPNSVCEAQMLGVPVVCTNVGGVSSIVEHEVNGFLFPSNDPYMAAYYINNLFQSVELNEQMGKNGHHIAIVRHDKKNIHSQILNIYNEILSQKN